VGWRARSFSGGSSSSKNRISGGSDLGTHACGGSWSDSRKKSPLLATRPCERWGKIGHAVAEGCPRNRRTCILGEKRSPSSSPARIFVCGGRGDASCCKARSSGSVMCIDTRIREDRSAGRWKKRIRKGERRWSANLECQSTRSDLTTPKENYRFKGIHKLAERERLEQTLFQGIPSPPRKGWGSHESSVGKGARWEGRFTALSIRKAQPVRQTDLRPREGAPNAALTLETL